jgi:hypothetical protein
MRLSEQAGRAPNPQLQRTRRRACGATARPAARVESCDGAMVRWLDRAIVAVKPIGTRRR